MDYKEVVEFLMENSLSDVDVVKDDNDKMGIIFFYDFDKDELDAASAYANEESDYDENSIEWYGEMFLPYLRDIAIDNVNDILEDLSDEFVCEYDMSYEEMDSSSYQYMKFYVAISQDDEIDIHEYMADMI